MRKTLTRAHSNRNHLEIQQGFGREKDEIRADLYSRSIVFSFESDCL